MSNVGGMALILAFVQERFSIHPLQAPSSFLAPLVSLFFVYLFGAWSLLPAFYLGFMMRQSVYADVNTVAMLAIRDLLIGTSAALVFHFCTKEKSDGLDLDDNGFRSLLLAIPDVLLIFDRNGKCCRLFSGSKESTTANWVGKTIHEILPHEEVERSLNAIQRVVDTGKPCSLESIVVREKEETKYFDVRIVPFRLQGRTAVLWASRDVSQFKEAQLLHQESDELLRNLLRLQERERKLISCEIHDGVLQQIIVSHMMAQLIEAKVSEYNDDDITENLNTLKLTLTEAIEEGRNLIQELRPIMVDEQNVVDAIGYLVKEESNRGLMRLDFEFEGDFDELSPLLEGNIFRITQEALTNARRHSKAKLVEVKLRLASNAIYLEICDDGVGFDTTRISETSFGLKSIARRAQLFGGEAKIASGPDQGTQIQVELPIDGVRQLTPS